MKQKNSLNIPVSDQEALLDLTVHMPGAWAHSDVEVVKLAEIAELRLDQMYMPKAKRKGVIATHVNEGPAARTYRFLAHGSAVTLYRAEDGWRVIDFAPRRVFPQQGGELILQISPQQAAAAAEAMRAACGVVVKKTRKEPA
jgi:hypothetical protein